MNKFNVFKLEEKMNRKVMLGVLISLILSLVAVGVSAFDPMTDCVDYVDVNGVTVCFLGNNDNGDGTVTWSYAVKADELNSTAALSHITFSICIDDAYLVDPNDGDTYSTPAQVGNVFGREGVLYNVDIADPDPTTGVSGIKFEDPTLEQMAGDTDIFQFTQPLQTNPGTEPNPVGVKAANGTSAMIEGPICDGTTAVNLVDFNASAGLFARLLGFLGLR